MEGEEKDMARRTIREVSVEARKEGIGSQVEDREQEEEDYE